MWRDELQAFMLAAASSTPLDLFGNLKYEGHPGLWHLLLWLITRFTSDPVAMQAAQLLIALGIWVLIWRVSPFRLFEKLLLLLSYYLFWEYFVVSRNYALGVLLGFGFVAVVVFRPKQWLWPWVLLGLLANTSVFGTIWSLALAALFAVRSREEWRALPGAAIYAGLTVLAVVSMVPASDAGFGTTAKIVTTISQAQFKPMLEALDLPLMAWPVQSAFFPFFPPFAEDADFIGGIVAKLSTSLPESSAELSLFLVLPILVCLSAVQDRLLVATYAATVIGILLFIRICNYEFEPRHHGFLFIALIGTVWMWRALPGKPTSWVWIGLLAVNALGGLTTLSSELRPYSQSRNTAIWLEQNHLLDNFLIGSGRASSVAGYLRRPLYYLECECFGTYAIFTKPRRRLDLEEFIARVERALTVEHRDTAILIVSPKDRFDLAEQQLRPDLVFEPIKRFPNAIHESETYVIYHAKKQSSN